MARIRSIKPEVRISEKVNGWPIECRYFWVLLWGYCDDYGYGRDNTRLIVADAFPLDDSVSAETVAEWMDLLWRDGVIERFMVGESQYFRVVNWEEHQKISHPAKQVLPTIEQATEILRRVSEDSGEVSQASEKTSPKQGAGSREQGDAQPKGVRMDALFDQFWSVWPLKKGKKEARDAFAKAIKSGVSLDQIIAGVENYKREIGPNPDWTKVKWPQGWLNGERWEDESVPVASIYDRYERPAAPEGQVWAADFIEGEA